MSNTVAQLKEKLKKYKVNTNGLLKAELEELLENLEEKRDVEYPDPAEVIYHPISPGVHQDLKKRLRKNGWATTFVPGFDESYVDEFKETIESFCPFRFDDPSTHKSASLPANLHGIFKQDLGHTKMQWRLREACIPIFEEIYGTNDLLCSFDSLNLSYQRKNDKTDSWFHLDQNRANRETKCYQGVVNFLPNGDDDGGLLLVDKSHLVYDQYLDNHPKSGYGWFRVSMGDPLFKGLDVLKINLQKGQICIWDSKVVHCNIQPQDKSLRMAAYVSMMPREGCDQKILDKRIKAFEDGKLTNHWTMTRQFMVLPMTSRFPTNNPKAPASLNVKKLNKIQKRLVGYDT